MIANISKLHENSARKTECVDLKYYKLSKIILKNIWKEVSII